MSDGTALSNVATVNLTVNPVNDAPVLVDDTATTDEDTWVNIPVLANDRPGPANEAQTLTITHLNGQPATVGTPVPTDHGTVVLNSDGRVTYTPAPDYHGADGFSYTAFDNGAPPREAPWPPGRSRSTR